MDEKDKGNVVHIDQADMDRFSKGAMAAILNLMNDEGKLSNTDKLLAIYGACLEVAWEIHIDCYRELLERASEANERLLPDVLDAYEQVQQAETKRNPMRFWSPETPDYVPYKDRS